MISWRFLALRVPRTSTFGIQFSRGSRLPGGTLDNPWQKASARVQSGRSGPGDPLTAVQVPRQAGPTFLTQKSADLVGLP